MIKKNRLLVIVLMFSLLFEVIVGVPTIGNAAAKGSEVVQRKQMIEKL